MSTIVLYDGPCTLCNKSVQWIQKRDINGIFYFSSLTSNWAKEHLPEYLMAEDSLVLFLNGQFYIRSKAVLLILEQLPGYRWTRILKYAPTFISDLFYRFIAKSRYRIFGKGYCALVPEERIVP